MPRRMVYALDMRGTRAGRARVAMSEHRAYPIEVAECVECGHPYLYHFHAVPVGVIREGVGCHGCGLGHRCARDTTSIEVAYYPKHDDAD